MNTSPGFRSAVAAVTASVLATTSAFAGTPPKQGGGYQPPPQRGYQPPPPSYHPPTPQPTGPQLTGNQNQTGIQNDTTTSDAAARAAAIAGGGAGGSANPTQSQVGGANQQTTSQKNNYYSGPFSSGLPADGAPSLCINEVAIALPGAYLLSLGGFKYFHTDQPCQDGINLTNIKVAAIYGLAQVAANSPECPIRERAVNIYDSILTGAPTAPEGNLCGWRMQHSFVWRRG